MTDAQRTPTSIDLIADAWVDTVAELSPGTATYIGRFEHNDRLDDLSPEGTERSLAATKATIAALEAAAPVDGVDEVTKADLLGELGLAVELHDAHSHLGDLNVADLTDPRILNWHPEVIR